MLAKANKTAVVKARRELGTLASLKVSTRTVNRYNKSMSLFFGWLQCDGEVLPSAAPALDLLICRWVEQSWQEGDGRCQASDLVCRSQWTSPGLKGQLRGAWALLKAWQHTELPARAPPLPVATLFAMAEW